MGSDERSKPNRAEEEAPISGPQEERSTPDAPAAADAEGPSAFGSGEPADADEVVRLQEQAVEACRSVYDPEIPVNVFDLGLIYKVEVRPDRTVAVDMTLTSPACPVAGTLPPEVAERIKAVPGIADAAVEVVWDPPWHPGMMTEEAQLELGFM